MDNSVPDYDYLNDGEIAVRYNNDTDAAIFTKTADGNVANFVTEKKIDGKVKVVSDDLTAHKKTYTEKINSIDATLQELIQSSPDMGGYAKEDWVEENFLPSSGGILCVSGDSSPLTIKGVGDDAYIDFQSQSNAALSAGLGVHSSLGPVYKNNADGSQAQPLIHSGNIKNYAPTYSANGNVGIGTDSPNYKLEVNGSFNAASGYIGGASIFHTGNLNPDSFLSKSGGTISANAAIPLYIKGTGDQTGIILGENKAQIGWGWVNNTIGYSHYLYNYASSHYLGVSDSGVPHFDSNTLIHSGNIGNQSVYYADSAGALITGGNIAAQANSNRSVFFQNYITFDSNAVYGIHRGSYTSSKLGTTDLYISAQNAIVFDIGKVGIGTLTPQYDLHVDGTMCGNLKMLTPRTIWGQSFDGTGNIDGDFKYRYINIHNNNEINSLNDDGTGAALCLNWVGAGDIILARGGGKVGVGTSSPSYKMDVYNNTTTTYDFHIYNDATKSSFYVGKDGLWYGSGLDEDVGIFRIHSACQYDGGGGRTEFWVGCSGEAVARNAFRLGGTGQDTSGLFVNSRITGGGYATDLWLYNNQRLLLYGTEILMQSNTSIAGNLTASGDISTNGHFIGSLIGTASSSNVLSTYAAPGNNDLDCLQKIFSTIPKSVGTAVRLEYGSHSMAFGWFLEGYGYDNAYGGWFISDYATPSWVGISNGQWYYAHFLTTANYTAYCTPSNIGAAPASHSHSWDEITSKPSVAVQGSLNNFVCFGNEFTFISDGYSGPIHINWRTASGVQNGNITDYIFENGAGSTNVAITASRFNGTASAADYATSAGYASSAGSAPASDVYGWAKAASKPSYSWSEIGSKPSFAAVATSGSYNDLSNKPSIPSIAGLASESWVSSNFLGLGGGTVNGSITATAFYQSSDRELKTNIKPVENALDYVLGTNYVTFDWKSNGKKSVGVIAQEEKDREFGFLVGHNGENYTYEYAPHVAILGAALKEEHEKVKSLEERIKKLEEIIEKLTQQ